MGDDLQEPALDGSGCIRHRDRRIARIWVRGKHLRTHLRSREGGAPSYGEQNGKDGNGAHRPWIESVTSSCSIPRTDFSRQWSRQSRTPRTRLLVTTRLTLDGNSHRSASPYMPGRM